MGVGLSLRHLWKGLPNKAKLAYAYGSLVAPPGCKGAHQHIVAPPPAVGEAGGSAGMSWPATRCLVAGGVRGCEGRVWGGEGGHP